MTAHSSFCNESVVISHGIVIAKVITFLLITTIWTNYFISKRENRFKRLILGLFIGLFAFNPWSAKWYFIASIASIISIASIVSIITIITIITINTISARKLRRARTSAYNK